MASPWALAQLVWLAEARRGPVAGSRGVVNERANRRGARLPRTGGSKQQWQRSGLASMAAGGSGMAKSSAEESRRRRDGGSRQRRKDDGSGAVNGRRQPDPAAGSSCAARRTKKATTSAPAGGSDELLTRVEALYSWRHGWELLRDRDKRKSEVRGRES